MSLTTESDDLYFKRSSEKALTLASKLDGDSSSLLFSRVTKI